METTMQKQLSQFLQEQQEPFTLEVYLLERGYLRKSFSSEQSVQSLSSNSSRFLKRSVSCGLKKRRKFIPNCSKIVKVVFAKLVPSNTNHSHNIKSSEHRTDQSTCHTEVGESRKQIPDDDKFSSASSRTVFGSCSESDSEGDQKLQSEEQNSGITGVEGGINLHSEQKVAADTESRWGGNIEESKQQSPVSVLQETESDYEDDELADHNTDEDHVKTSHEESSSPGCLCITKSKKSTRDDSFSGQHDIISRPDSCSSHYYRNKRAVQQTKQLLLDCLREVVESQSRRDPPRLLGPEELWKLICEKIWLWSRDSIDESNIYDLVYHDLQVSSAQKVGGDSEQQMHEIAKEIGEAILEDICHEIIVNFIK